MLCKLVVSLQMQNRKTTDKISIVPNLPNYSIVIIAGQRALHLHFATDNQLVYSGTGLESTVFVSTTIGLFE